MLKIGTVELKGRIVAAPLAGISNPVYRQVCHDAGAALCVSEMISDKALHYQNERTFDMCRVSETEHPVSLQLFGGDPETMAEAAEYLIGMHDYRSFCGNSRMKKSSIRVVDVIRIEESGNYIRFYYHGNGFLQNMVRIMTGTLLEVGMGKREPGDMEEIIEARDRRKAGYTAPAQGLCLMKVDY